jgi:hypothetical protein
MPWKNYPGSRQHCNASPQPTRSATRDAEAWQRRDPAPPPQGGQADRRPILRLTAADLAGDQEAVEAAREYVDRITNAWKGANR